VTHPSLERLESDSSKFRETWIWLIQVEVLRDLKVTHPSLERLENDSSKSWETWKWLIKKINHIQDPDVLGFGEGALQKTGILQSLYKSGKVCTRCVEHSSIPHLWYPPWPCEGLGRKRSFYLGKNPSLKTGSITVWQGDWGQGKLENLSRLGWLWVIWTHNRSVNRATGHFQSCFPAISPVSRPVFASKHDMSLSLEVSVRVSLNHLHVRVTQVIFLEWYCTYRYRTRYWCNMSCIRKKLNRVIRTLSDKLET
jgi:hypothetical protein